MTMEKKVIIVEFYNSHTEVLYSSIEFFSKSGYTIHLWLNESQNFNRELTPFVNVNYHKSNSHLSRILFIVNLIKYILINKIDKVFINTADGLQVRNFCMISVPFNYEISGILHLAERLISSTTQKIISWKLKKYFILSHYILKNVEALNISGLKFGVFYPLSVNYKMKGLKKSGNSIVVSIPGEISPYRKSYFKLLEILENSKSHIPENLMFELLGTVRIKEGEEVINRINKYGLNDFFILYDEFIPDNKYYERCELSDIIMPLILPDVDNFENYLKFQITGAYDIAYGFKKPLLLHSIFQSIDDFNGIAVFFNENNLIDVLKNISSNKYYLDSIHNNYKLIGKFVLETQRKQFIDIIES
jgi:hypothetical protein